jgi:hypothetical protein
MEPSFFKMSGRSLFNSDWGDYGEILQHGISTHLPRRDGKVSLERTGPFIPPITLPFAIVVTAEARTLLESSGLSGFSFLPVEKARVVELHWERWDLEAQEPAEYPESGEPEDYILARPHSKAAATALGDLWEILVPPTVTILRPNSIVRSYKDLRLDTNTWKGEDLIRGDGYGSVLLSQRAMEWFGGQWTKYLRFDLFPSS